MTVMVVLGIAIVRGDIEKTAFHRNALLPLRRSSQVELADIGPGFEIVTIDIIAIDPVR